MKVSSSTALVLFLSTLILGATNAKAGCWPVWEGVHSHMECDASGATPTFENLKQGIRDLRGTSPECKQAAIKVGASYLKCGYAIFSAIETGGATVWVGAGGACYEFSEELKAVDTVCKEYVNLRTRPISAKVCNSRNETIDVAIARRKLQNEKISSGWFKLAKGECRDFSYPDTTVIYAMALVPGGGRIWPKYADDNNLDNTATFCINRRTKFTDFDVDICHNAGSLHNAYDYNKPGDLKFTNFGRVSKLTNGFTFK